MAVNKTNTSTFLSLGAGVEPKVSQLLAPILADTIFICSLYKKYSWHVEGDDFYQYRSLFAKHAKEQLPLIDVLAERIRTIDGVAPLMPAEVEKSKTLQEPANPEGDDEDMIENMCKIHEKFIKNLRLAIEKSAQLGDVGTSDLLVRNVLSLHETQLWVVRSSLD
jgi:starvation-inducible DNA-binding protein